MTDAALRKIQCWNCEEVNSVTYGGDARDGAERCDNCNEVIAESEIDSITIPESKEQALAIQERHGDFTMTERVKRKLGLL